MNRAVLAGFVPLVDAAVLIAAREKGFARAHGIELGLVKEASWASLRDHLNLGHLDCAQALAPLPIAAVLGIGQVQAQLGVPFVLGRGGNAITVSKALADELRAAAGGRRLSGPADWGAALARVVRKRERALTLAMVYPFSGHNFEIRYWLAASGVHPDRDLRLVAIPPPLMVESLRAGHVDGFCVGEPWNSLAAAGDLGEVIVRKSEIFPRGIEKVLAVPDARLADVEDVAPLLESLAAAARWCDEPAHRDELADLLARPEYLGVPPEVTRPALEGTIARAGGAPDAEFLYFSRFDANRPRVEEALWIYAQMRRWGQLPSASALREKAARVFRPDVYAAVFGEPDESEPPTVSACDGFDFDGRSVAEYLGRFALSTPFEPYAADP